MLPFLSDCGVQTLHKCYCVLPAHLSVKAATILILEVGTILCHFRVTQEAFLRMANRTLASSAPTLLSFPSGNTSVYMFLKMRHWQNTQEAPFPVRISHGTGITLPCRLSEEPESVADTHSLSLRWQLPGWHQWVLEEAEPVGGVWHS